MANPKEEKPVLHTKKHIARLERERRQTRLILYAFIGILVVVAGLITYSILYTKYLQAKEPVAKVGNVNIALGEWQARVQLERANLENEYNYYQQYAQFGLDVSSQLQSIQTQLGDPTKLGQTVLDNMIDEELIRQEAAKRGITVSKSEVDAAIQSAFQYYPGGSPTPTITPTAVTLPTLSPQTLALVTITPTSTVVLTPTSAPTSTPASVSLATGTPTGIPSATATVGPTDTPLPTSTPYTLQGYQQSYDKYIQQIAKIGLTEEQFRLSYETSLLRKKLTDVITADTAHTQDEIWARHILVADEATANAVRQRLLNGEDFAKVAAELSTDTGTKDKGGDLGWFGRGTMVPEFEAVAFTLNIGQISQPVKSQFGYHIIQVLDRANIPLDATAYDQARQKAFSDWLAQARKDYKVVTYTNWQNLIPTAPGASTAVPQ